MNRFRNETLRLSGYDYANNGSYFITICSQGKQPIFGHIQNGQVYLSQIGRLIEAALNNTSTIRKYVSIGECVIMPDHIHVIIHIHHDSDGSEWLPSEGIHSRLVLDEEYKNHFGPQSKNLASIIRGIKSAVTASARKEGLADQIWQKNYYEHIIRSQEELERIEKYIHENPIKHQTS